MFIALFNFETNEEAFEVFNLKSIILKLRLMNFSGRERECASIARM